MVNTAEKRDSFLFYRSYIEAVDKLPADRRYDFLHAIACYALDGTQPGFDGAEDIAFGLMKANIDSCNKRYTASVENGKKGGNPNFKKGRRNPYYKRKKITQDNPADNPNENVNDDVNETNHHLHDDSVSCGSPLNAEPPSTQSTGDPFAKSKLRKFLEEKGRGAGETDAK